MKTIQGLFSLALSAVLCCYSNADQQEFMLLAGPLTADLESDLGASARGDVFDCRRVLPLQSREYFQHLQRRGVNRFKVPLSWSHVLPTGDPNQPHEDTVTCYKTLVKQLTESGIKPLLVLHRSSVPERFRSRHGGWENPSVVQMFEQYVGFAFDTFKDLVDTFITFSHLHELHDEELQNALQAHANIYKLSHPKFKGVYGFPLSAYAVQLQIAKSGRELAGIAVLQNKDLHIRGCDITQLFGNVDQEQTLKGLQNENEKADISYQKVWEKFKSQSEAQRDQFLNDSFPAGFQWSVSSESFKVEGGWSEYGKGETIWDRFSHEGRVFGNQTTDLACDTYHKVDYDVYLLRGMQAPHYQFSISWARIFPNGRKESFVEKGAMYYDNMINKLLQSGIEPTVTLYHWDLPQALQEQGGWTNESIVEAFKEFADFCFSRYGDRVKTWNTFGIPWVVSNFGYGTGEHPPSIKDPVIASYQVTHNILKSHAEAWHTYNDKYRKMQNGKVGIALYSEWTEPKNPSNSLDSAAAARYLNFMLGWFAHPIFVNGDYSAVLKDQIKNKNNVCGKELARLPVFTEVEMKRIQGTADFFGLNHYTTRLISEVLGICDPGLNNVGDFKVDVDPTWPNTSSDHIHSVPWGLRRLLNYISVEYTSITKVPIYITGNGMPTEYSGDVFDDTHRVDFLKAYINEAMKAVQIDGVNVQRFTVQSLMDGFEGPQGYSQRFGLHYVNFEDPDRPRTPKSSAYYYSKLIERNGFAEIPSKPASQIYGNEIKNSRLPALPPSNVPSTSKVVWEKFSPQTKFERQLYHYGSFPEDFHWGVSSSAYQVEGGWNVDGKGVSVWDTFTQKPGSIPNNDNGNVACDSYNKIDEDLYMLKALQMKNYRFSISWSRIFPNGYISSLNQKGVDYYNRLIDGLVANKIQPMVTLYNWDLPQALQDINGWENPDMMNIFNDYCDFCYKTFGDRVKFWITLNEPHTIAWSGYGLGLIPPNIKLPGDAPYRVAHNLLKAHAKAYHTYDDKYRATQKGLVSISLNAEWVEPQDVTVLREVVAADRALQFQLGWFAHPIFKNGDYPDAMKWQVSNKTELQGSKGSRLPTFTDEDKAYIQGTADVFCINTYTTKVVRHATISLSPASYQNDQDVIKEEADGALDTAVQDQKAVSWGLRRLLNWIKEEYGDPEVYITENGVSTSNLFTTDDTDRIFSLKTYIDEALKAQNLDGVRLKGYIASPLMDSFEWLNGYSVGYGLNYVDFKHPSRPRTPKRSAHLYFDIMRNNGFPMTEEERIIHGHFKEGFVWSTATAAYQIEGAWRADGKGLSIWDQYTHTPSNIENDANGDIACNSYTKIDEDVNLIKMMKVKHYRFSISWPRILPDGTNSKINEAGLNYYHRLVDALLAANIQPQATLYHWDLPQALEDVGGWQNETVVSRFRDYADIIFNSLGHKIKFWMTLNEPLNVALNGYGFGAAAPGITLPATAPYIVAHNLLKAHAEVWHLYDEKYRATQGGVIGMTVNSDWAQPRNPYKQEDVDAARRTIQKLLEACIELLKRVSSNRLPEFTPAEIKRIKGTHDYFGFNHYTTVLAFNVDYGDLQHYDADRGSAVISDRTWLESGSFWLKVNPPGFRKILNFIKEEYGNPPVYITENGVSERGPVNLNDISRIHYYKNYINQVLKAYLLDGVDMRGYAAWSLMDNLEWGAGYDETFGLFYVNRSDPNLPRIPKKSAWHYATLVSCNGFVNPTEGPHECEVLDPEDGNTGPTTPPPPVGMLSVNFLGLDVPGPDAEVALNALFSLTIIGVVGVVLLLFGVVKAAKKTKRPKGEDIALERQF
ncbi:Lactase-phlorizin hydrolase [Triplophysa tibetana]|uniref:Cytosolic beta-glucosidase n=1 Tax=Triplophysa tibetana TaxID=1572043 RepID=A0A5A9P469_9TELE|nr:Lactase-phlorizin hydrolase [Triplophysa tibetana]